MTHNGTSSKGDAESQEIQEQFLSRLSKVADGSVYTLDRICDIIGCKENNATEFVRMCDISPAVEVHRHYGRKGSKQYSFLRTNAVAATERVKQLAKEISDDPNVGGRSKAAANKIIVLLGG